MWMFDAKGQIILKKDKINDEEELLIIESGAEDIIKNDNITIITNLENLEKAKDNLEKNNFNIESSEMIYLAKEKIEPKDEEKLLKLLETLDEDDDVNNIYTNTDI